MRFLGVTAALLTSAGVARADSFVELGGGLTIPVADSDWTKTADTSPKLRAAVGAEGHQGLGGMISADWTPVNLNNDGASFGVGSADLAAHRFRFLANLVYHHPVAPKLVASGRIGLGLDLAHASASVTLLGNTTSTSDTNAGFAFEVAGGLWYSLGDIQIGGELALPFGWHSKHGDNTDGNYVFDYTSTDIDLLIGIRLLSR